MRRVTLWDERVKTTLEETAILYSNDTRASADSVSLSGGAVGRMLIPVPGGFRPLTKPSEGADNFGSCFCDGRGRILRYVGGFRSPEHFLQEIAAAERQHRAVLR